MYTIFKKSVEKLAFFVKIATFVLLKRDCTKNEQATQSNNFCFKKKHNYILLIRLYQVVKIDTRRMT